MSTRTPSITIIVLIVVALFALVLTGCAATEPTPEPKPVPAEDAPAPDDAASGSRLAPGLYDLSDGGVQAIGTLEYSDIEGGFWKISGGTAAEGNIGETVVVIANSNELAAELEPLEGKTVTAVGERQEGASIRMAGPEMIVVTISEITDTPGAAE